jgi:hypothetical protein
MFSTTSRTGSGTSPSEVGAVAEHAVVQVVLGLEVAMHDGSLAARHWLVQVEQRVGRLP